MTPTSAHIHAARRAEQACLLELLRGVRQAVYINLWEYARGGNARVHPPLAIPNRLRDFPHSFLSQTSSARPRYQPPPPPRPPRTHLVSHVRADILQPPLPARPRLPPHRLRVLAHLHPLLARRLRQVHAIHRACPRLDERERHLEPDPAVRARDERDAVPERELVREVRRRRRRRRRRRARFPRAQKS